MVGPKLMVRLAEEVPRSTGTQANILDHTFREDVPNTIATFKKNFVKDL